MDMLVIGIGFIQSLFIGWVIVGFLVSMKVLFLDGINAFYEEAVDAYLAHKENEHNKIGMMLGKAFKHQKWVFVVTCSLLGHLALHFHLSRPRQLNK